MSLNPQTETKTNPTETPSTAPSTPTTASTPATPTTPSTPSAKKNLRDFANSGAYTPKTPPTQVQPEQQLQQQQQMLGVGQNRYSYYPQPYYGGYMYQPAGFTPYSPNVNPIGFVPRTGHAMAAVPAYMPSQHAVNAQHAVAASMAPTAAPVPAEATALASTTHTPATTATTPNGSVNGEAKNVTPPTATPVTPVTATPVAANVATPNASTAASLMIPKDTRSALNTSAEISLQPPIKKAKATASAAAAAPKPEESKTEAKPEATTETKAAETAKNTSASKPTESAPVASAPVVTDAAKTTPVAKEVAAAVPATTSAKPAEKTEKPVEVKPETKAPNALKDSFDVNFEVDEAYKKPSTEPQTTKTAEAVKPAAGAAVAATPASTVAANADAKPKTESPIEAKVETKTESPKTESVSSTTSTASSANASSVATATAAAPASAGEGATNGFSTPVKAAPASTPYKVTAADQANAKKSDDAVGPPPGLLIYTAEQLMNFAALAKSAPAPPHLLRSLDHTTINSPGGRGGGKGGGGKGGRRGGGDKMKQGPPPTAVRPIGIEPGSLEAKSRTFRGILNKITPETFDRLVQKMLAVPVENPETLAALVDIIADVSVREMKFCAMYANLCAELAATLPPFEVPQEGEEKPLIVSFRTVILIKCQSIFNARHPVLPVPAEITDPEQRQEWELKQNKIRTNMLGLVKFLGELAIQRVLSGLIIPDILKSLWEAKLGYDDLELYTILLSTYGKQLPNSGEFVDLCRNWIIEYVGREKDKQDPEGTRIRYLMQDTIDLAENNWVPRSASAAAQGPKTLAEIHDDIARQERQKEAELKNANKKGGYGRPMAQPIPKTPGRGNTPSILMRDTPPRNTSSPSQGGRGKPSFASQSTLSPNRASSSGAITPSSSGVTSPILSNAFDSLSSESSAWDPNYSTNVTSSAPGGDDEPQEVEEMDAAALDNGIEEFLDSNVADEAVETLSESPALEDSCKYFISRLLLKVLDISSDTKRNWSIDLLKLFLKPEYNLTDTDRTVVPGLTQTVADLDILDVPKAPGYLGIMLAECLKHKIISPSAINKILAPLLTPGTPPARSTQMIVSMWSHLPAEEVPALIKSSNFNISVWNIPDDKVPSTLKCSFETVESQLSRGDDPLKVALWAKANNPSSLKSKDFYTRVINRMVDDVKKTQNANDEQLIPVIQALLAGSASKFQDELAMILVNGFRFQPALGTKLFDKFVEQGLAKKKFLDASNRIDGPDNRYTLDKGFGEWIGAASAGSSNSKASSSGSKSSKGGKSKSKRK